MSLGPCLVSARGWQFTHSYKRSCQQFTPRRVATMTAYDSIERGAADECEPLTGRRPRTFTLTQLLVACGAVCVCAIGATMFVNAHGFRPNLAESSRLGDKVDWDLVTKPGTEIWKTVCTNRRVRLPDNCKIECEGDWGVCDFKCTKVYQNHRVCTKIRDLEAEARRRKKEAVIALTQLCVESTGGIESTKDQCVEHVTILSQFSKY